MIFPLLHKGILRALELWSHFSSLFIFNFVEKWLYFFVYVILRRLLGTPPFCFGRSILLIFLVFCIVLIFCMFFLMVLVFGFFLCFYSFCLRSVSCKPNVPVRVSLTFNHSYFIVNSVVCFVFHLIIYQDIFNLRRYFSIILRTLTHLFI